jgi:hypothetical protein
MGKVTHKVALSFIPKVVIVGELNQKRMLTENIKKEILKCQQR